MAHSFLLGIRGSPVGLSILAVHMIVSLCSQDAHITSAVCLDAYFASGIVGSKPTETSLAVWKVAKGHSYILFLFAYTPCFQRTCPRSARHRFEFQHGV